MDSSKIKAIIVAVLALFAALYLGISAATAQVETVMWVVGGSGLAVCFTLGKRIWMILPFLGGLGLTLMIPGQPSTLLLAQAVFIGFCCVLFLMRALPARFVFTELEFWVLLLALAIFQAYARNPVGINLFGGESMGGKPYAMFLITLVSSMVLGSLRIPPPDLRWILKLSIIAGIISFCVQTVGYFVPGIGVWYGAAGLENSNASGIETGAYGANVATRIGFLGTTARNLSLWVSTFISPIRACFDPRWAPLVLLSLAFATASGFRNEVVSVGLIYLIGIAYRGGLGSLLISGLSLAMALAVLAFVNLSNPLPANIQRSLGFLPGTWDQDQVEDGENSTTWRVEMWKEALFTDFWIKNKILGDGLGLTREEYNFISSLKGVNIGGAVGSGKITLQQQLMMAAGNYHSGPVQSIRYIGYLGLLILLLAQIRLAVHAHRQIKRARNTEWFPLALFIGIPLIKAPFFFVFVFGDFGATTASFLLGVAFVRLLETNLPLPSYVKQRN